MKLRSKLIPKFFLITLLLLCVSLTLANKAQAMAQITMVNRSQLALNLYISDNGRDFYFGCGPVLGLGHFTNSPGQFCTSSITPGIHWLQARDGDKVVMHEDNVNIGDGTSPTWTVTIAADPDEELIRRLNGAKFRYDQNLPEIKENQELIVSGTTLIIRGRIVWANKELEQSIITGTNGFRRGVIGQWQENQRMQIKGREAHFSAKFWNYTFTISEDGNSIVRRSVRLMDGQVETDIFERVFP